MGTISQLLEGVDISVADPNAEAPQNMAGNNRPKAGGRGEEAKDEMFDDFDFKDGNGK